MFKTCNNDNQLGSLTTTVSRSSSSSSFFKV